MLKIFLAEDEFVVRNGIRTNIDWKGSGYEFVGDAADGELAWPMIRQVKPDIVITDIRMPFMDGLELSRLIKKELPQTEIIVLTGFEEFDYARRAVNIGVAKYLLKPVNSENLLKEIDELADKIEEKRRHEQLRAQYRADMEEKERSDRREFFRALVTGSSSVSSLLDQASLLSIDLSASWYNIVLFRAWSAERAPDAFSHSIVKIDEAMAKLQVQDQAHVLIFDRALEGKAILFKAGESKELCAAQEHFIQQLTSFLKNYPNIRYFGGVGDAVRRLSEVSVSFENASHAIAHRFLYPESTFFPYSAIDKTPRRGILKISESEARQTDSGKKSVPEAEQPDPLKISKIAPAQVDRRKISAFLRSGDREEVSYFADEFFGDISQDALESSMFRNYIVLDLWFAVQEFLDEIGADRSDAAPLTEPGAEQMKDVDRTRSYAASLLTAAIDIRDSSVKTHYTQVVDEALKYIEEHYADETLSLNDLASRVNVSPNHLSTLFSQQTGQPFIRYLTDLRMKRAKELLLDTNEKTRVIGQMVGYQDPHYFSYLFRKTVGMPPTQFRQKQG